MKLFIIFAIVIIAFTTFSQEVLKENLTKKTSLFWDFNKTQIQAIGSYFKDEVDETTEKHGKWQYYDRLGVLEEERNYYKDMLHGKVILFFPNKKQKQEGYFYLDQQDSVYREWFENGKLAVQGQYDMNEPIGQWTYYYQDGREKSVEEMRDKVNHVLSFWLPDSLHTQIIINGTGELTTFYTTGTVKEWYNYTDGLKNGPFEELSIYGYNMLSGFFKNGEKDSTWTYAYYTGDKEKISNYKNGVLNGEYNYFYDMGQLNVHGYYKDGKKYGKWTWYTNKGTRDMEGFFENDLQNGDWTYWYPTGEISYNAHFKEGLKSGQWTYFYIDGSKFKEGTFAADEKNGTWQTWYEDGTLLMKGDYIAGKEDGEWSNYWESGALKNKTNFKEGEMNGDWVSYYPTSKLKTTGKYDGNLKVGEWVDYFENGKPKELITYKIFKEKTKVDYGIMKDRVRLESKKDGHSISYSMKDFQKTEEGDYKEGKKNGEWIAYYPGGRNPAVISNYQEEELNGTMKQFDRRGNILQEMDYKNGLKHGRFIVYDKKGKILVEKEFEHGMQVIKGQTNTPGSFSPR
jgi:antitoxin component YwqK of YwqJK toxin-antitoxin module